SCWPAIMPVDFSGPMGPKLFIWGEPVLRKYYTVYNWREKSVGFGLARHVPEGPGSTAGGRRAPDVRRGPLLEALLEAKGGQCAGRAEVAEVAGAAGTVKFRGFEIPDDQLVELAEVDESAAAECQKFKEQLEECQKGGEGTLADAAKRRAEAERISNEFFAHAQSREERLKLVANQARARARNASKKRKVEGAAGDAGAAQVRKPKAGAASGGASAAVVAGTKGDAMEDTAASLQGQPGRGGPRRVAHDLAVETEDGDGAVAEEMLKETDFWAHSEADGDWERQVPRRRGDRTFDDARPDAKYLEDGQARPVRGCGQSTTGLRGTDGRTAEEEALAAEACQTLADVEEADAKIKCAPGSCSALGVADASRRPPNPLEADVEETRLCGVMASRAAKWAPRLSDAEAGRSSRLEWCTRCALAALQTPARSGRVVAAKGDGSLRQLAEEVCEEARTSRRHIMALVEHLKMLGHEANGATNATANRTSAAAELDHKGGAAKMKDQMGTVWTTDTNSWNSAARLLEEARSKGMRLPEYVLLQEHRGKTKKAAMRVCTWARWRAWTAAADQAWALSLESSGGTAVLTTRGRGSKHARMLRLRSHMLVAMEVDLDLQVKVIIASAHLEHSAGLEGDMQLPETIGGQARGQGRPWVTGDDWNMDPCLFQDCAHKNLRVVITSGEAGRCQGCGLDPVPRHDAHCLARCVAVFRTLRPRRAAEVTGLKLLSESLKGKIRYSMFELYISRHALFRVWVSVDPALAHMLCRKCQGRHQDEKRCLEFQYTRTQDDLFQAGVGAESVYLLISGKMEYVQEPDFSPVLDSATQQVPEGSWLAEPALWAEWKHVGTALATAYSRVMK
ncbi:unnamed protein product, partial [Prorocentrum cordatum]